MKTIKLAAAVATLAALLFVALPNLAWAAEDGKTAYGANCAACHKADGSGNPAMKAPALKGKTAAEVKKVLDTNAKHAAVAKKVNPEQVKAIGAYLQTLK